MRWHRRLMTTPQLTERWNFNIKNESDGTPSLRFLEMAYGFLSMRICFPRLSASIANIVYTHDISLAFSGAGRLFSLYENLFQWMFIQRI